MRAWRTRRHEGFRLGRPTKVNAYRDDVARLRAQGLTGHAIAKELGIPSSSVFQLIKGARVPLARLLWRARTSPKISEKADSKRVGGI
jgi:predicted transcriptional regulator